MDQFFRDLEGNNSGFLAFTDALFNQPVSVFSPHFPGNENGWGQYQRKVVYVGAYTVVLISWGPGSLTAIHDHGRKEARVKLLKGRIREICYAFDGDLKMLSNRVVGEGGILEEHVEGIHRVECLDPDFSVTLHVSDGAQSGLDGVRIFDEVSRRIGILNSAARASSWQEPLTSFREIIPF